MAIRRDPRTRKWYFRATVETPTGKRRISGTPGVPGPYQDLAQTKVGAAEAERRAIAAAMTAPVKSAGEVQTVGAYAETFLELYAAAHKPSEKRSKKWILDSSLIPHFGAMKLDAISQSDVDSFVVREQRKGNAAKTINNKLAVLSSLLKYAADNQIIARPRLRFTVATAPAELVAVALADVDRLLEVADPTLKVAVLLAAEAGLRAGEIRGLQWGDIVDGVITIRRALDNATDDPILPKHNKRRMVPVSERLAAALERAPRRGLWIVARPDGGARSQRGVYGLYEPMCALYDAAGVARPPSPIHCLRHTFGTELAARGVPLPVIQELMGHASITTTRRYVHVNERQKTEAIRDAFGRAPGAKEKTK